MYDVDYVDDEDTGDVVTVDVDAGRIPGYEGTERDVTIPSEIDEMPVLEIADKAFYRKNLTSVTFPSEIEEIGNLAFGDNVINYIVVYGHDTNAMHDSFDSNDLKTIYGHNDSNIESYAERILVECRNIGTYDTVADIVSVDHLPSRETIYGEAPIPPDKVEVTLDNDAIISVNVFWDEVKSCERSTIVVTMSGTLI